MFRVYDDRTNETILETKNRWEAVLFMTKEYDEDHEDFGHIWLEEI